MYLEPCLASGAPVVEAITVADTIQEICKKNGLGSEVAGKHIKNLQDECCCSWSAVQSLGAQVLQEQLHLPRGLALELSNKAKHQSSLPFPELPENRYPEAGKMQEHLSDASVPKLKERSVQGSKAMLLMS